jgi:hypothetical protein
MGSGSCGTNNQTHIADMVGVEKGVSGLPLWI